MKVLVGFCGSPYSGKTTTAAHVFAELKRTGLPVEFYPEAARAHIMDKRASTGKHEVVLTDEDQLAICRTQWEWENHILKHSGESVILVSDGSTVNAHFYTSEPVIDPIKTAGRYHILFFCRNIDQPRGEDGNRLHDQDFSKATDAAMKAFFDAGFVGNVTELSGGIDDRVARALATIQAAIKPSVVQ